MGEQGLIPGVDAIPAKDGGGKCAGLSIRERLLVFARLLVLQHDEDGLAVPTAVDAAVAAGLVANPDNRDSAKSLASRHRRNPVVMAEISRLRAQIEGEQDASRAEVLGMWRGLYSELTGKRKIRVASHDAEGNFTGFKQTLIYKPELAEKVVEKMARAAGVLEDGRKAVQVDVGERVLISGVPVMSDSEWEAAHG